MIDPPSPVLSSTEIEKILLAPYAAHSCDSAGRKYPEPPHPYRTCYQRDRDRLVHSAAYRRLSSKTQVFTGDLGDYHRTRLTHTLEVASIARNLARALRLNEDLAEASALAHDLGHPPFGHAGEDALDECLRDQGGFCHNRHGLRIVEELEQRYPDFPGLNLSLELLEGQMARVQKGSAELRPLLESQVVEAADGVAYNTHDADDAIQMGLLELDELLEIPLCREAARRAGQRYSALDGDELKRAVLHELIDWQVGDLLAMTREQLAAVAPQTTADVRRAEWMVRPSREIAEQRAELSAFLFERVYRHPELLKLRGVAQSILHEMFEGYSRRPDYLPTSFQERMATAGAGRTICDYIAGMTDRFATREYARLFATRRGWRLPELTRRKPLAARSKLSAQQ